MLISSDPNSPHHYSRKFYGRVLVYLNGERARHVVEADDVEGYIVHNRVDADGCLVRNGKVLVYDRTVGSVSFEGIRRGDV